MALRKILGANHILIQTENAGDTFKRTVRLEISSGRIRAKSSKDGEVEL
jgi:hypothetical protein